MVQNVTGFALFNVAFMGGEEEKGTVVVTGCRIFLKSQPYYLLKLLSHKQRRGGKKKERKGKRMQYTLPGFALPRESLLT